MTPLILYKSQTSSYQRNKDEGKAKGKEQLKLMNKKIKEDMNVSKSKCWFVFTSVVTLSQHLKVYYYSLYKGKFLKIVEY